MIAEAVSWEQMEAEFRFWSFGIYYRRTFAGEADLCRRFILAVLASARPIRDRDAVRAWYWSHRRKPVRS
ncbi:MAG: hypothetical protein ACOC93_00110 [Planctomycetota bacterium]